MLTDASLKKAGKFYAITISSSGLTPAATSAFSVRKPPRGSLASIRRPSTHPRIARETPAHAMGMPHTEGTSHIHTAGEGKRPH
jgi:hypothetical protein